MLIGEFRSALEAFWIWRSKKQTLDAVQSVLASVHQIMREQHNKVFDSYAGAFDTIAEVLSTDSIAAIETATAQYGNTTAFSVPMVNIADVNDVNSVLSQFIQHWLTDEYIQRISHNLIENMLDQNTKDAWRANANFAGVEQMKKVFSKQFEEFSKGALQKMIVIANMIPPQQFGRTVDDILEAISETIDNDNLFDANGAVLSDDRKWDMFAARCAELGYPAGHTPLTDAARKIYMQASAVRQCAAMADLGSTHVSFADTSQQSMLCLMDGMPQLNREIAALSPIPPSIGNFPGIFNLIVNSGVPLYFLEGMDENQRAYAEAVQGNNMADVGMHMDCGSMSWKDFPPLVNNRVYKLKYEAHPDIHYQTFVDYQMEDNRLRDTKTKADCCLESGLISEPMPDFRMLFSLREDRIGADNTQTQIQSDVVELYLDRIRNAAANTTIPDTALDPEKAWDEEFERQFTEPKLWELLFEAYRKRIVEHMRRSGATAAAISDIENLTAATAAASDDFWNQMGAQNLLMERTKADVPFPNLDKVSVGDYLLPTQGGLYRTVRLSLDLRTKLDAAYRFSKDMTYVLNEAKKNAKILLRKQKG